MSRAETWLHRVAVLTGLATLPLVFVGGAVTSKNAGLSVPDWPLSYGSLNPPGWWQVDNVRVEHGHRLLGASVGLLTITLVVVSRLAARPTVRRLALVLLVGVCVQGLLGGLRVIWLSTALAVVHGVLAQVFFCAMACFAVLTGPAWTRQVELTAGRDQTGIRPAAVVAAIALFAQLIMGACLRHLGSGLVLHIAGALVVVASVMNLLLRVLSAGDAASILRRAVVVLTALVGAQVIIGPLSWWVVSGFPDNRTATLLEWLLPTLHVAFGALGLTAGAVALLSAFCTLLPRDGAAIARMSGSPSTVSA